MRLDIDTVEIPALRPVCECRAGDPDPGPEQHARGGLRGVPCGDVVSYPGAQWLCTLPAGHCGAHIAGDGHTAVAVWTAPG
jgi:hypothetical protein